MFHTKTRSLYSGLKYEAYPSFQRLYSFPNLTSTMMTFFKRNRSSHSSLRSSDASTASGGTVSSSPPTAGSSDENEDFLHSLTDVQIPSEAERRSIVTSPREKRTYVYHRSNLSSSSSSEGDDRMDSILLKITTAVDLIASLRQDIEATAQASSNNQ